MSHASTRDVKSVEPPTAGLIWLLSARSTSGNSWQRAWHCCCRFEKTLQEEDNEQQQASEQQEPSQPTVSQAGSRGRVGSDFYRGTRAESSDNSVEQG